MKEKIEQALVDALQKIGVEKPTINLGHPEDISHGDFATSVALSYAKALKMNPQILAEKIVEELKGKMPKEVEKVEIAGPGFINFKLHNSYFTKEILKVGAGFGKGSHDKSKKIMVEYTDPNPFKIFHIGHLMANAIGESLSRVIEFSGADVIRACYQGDVGLHVAKTLWAVMQNRANFPAENSPLVDRIRFLGEMYVIGNDQYETNEKAKSEIIEINKQIFERSNPEINSFYKKGREWSLEYFDTLYKKLGTHFNNFFFESEVAEPGVKLVKEFLKKGIFEESQGAIVFPGEKYDTHTRVFINSQGLPTYEAKELGLTAKKFEIYPDLFESVVVTANEQNSYFKVLIEALKICIPNAGKKTKHLSHGILRPSSGKMSSRKGNVVSAEDLLYDFESLVHEKMKDRKFDAITHTEVQTDVAIAALKYVILRQAIGGDIIYDPEKAISFEGDSGPYLQYATVRAGAVIAKAHDAKISAKVSVTPEKVELLEKLILRFPGIISRARTEYAPHHIVTYLIELASAFNSYYAQYQIIDVKDPLSPYRVHLTKVFAQIMQDGLWVLGIKVPKKM